MQSHILPSNVDPAAAKPPIDPTWRGLTSVLSNEGLQLIETAVVEEMLSNPLNANSIDALIILSKGRYFLRQRIEKGATIAHRLRPVSPEALSAVFNNDQHDTGWLPENVVRVGRSVKGAWAVYAINAGMHTIEVVSNERSHKRHVPLPPMLWLGLEEKYWLFALKRKFTPDAKLYRVPLPNVNEEGVVCFGQNKVPKVTAQSIVDAWKLFIETPFNDHTSANKSRAFPATVLHQLQRLHQTNTKRYPLNDLIPDDRRSATAEVMIAHLLFDPTIKQRGDTDELD